MNIPPPPANSKQSFFSKWPVILGILGLLVVILLVGGCSSYNGMVKSEEAVNEAWGNVQASYQRRFDLIPNLVETVKGYATHESSTLQNVTNARQGLLATGDSLVAVKNSLGAFDPNSQGPSMEQMESLAKGLNVYVNAVREAYPDLKASANFMDLQKQLESTENRINDERNQYNVAVKAYNISIRTFPRNIFAGLFGFSTKNQFAAATEAQSAPKVNFN